MSEQEINNTSTLYSRPPKGISFGNPVFVKELRGLLRQQRSRFVLTSYMIVLAVIAFFLYATIMSANAVSPDPDIRRSLGKIIFFAIVFVQLGAIYFILPLFSAGSITSELENRTLDLLQITLLGPSSIIRGKILAGLMFALLLLFAGLPLQGSAYLLGGITLTELLVSTALLLATTLFLISVSLWASTRVSNTSSAIGLAYTIAGFIFWGVPILGYIILNLAPIPQEQGLFVVLQWVSRFLTPRLQPIFIILVWFLISSTPISTAFVSYSLFQNEGVRVFYDLAALKLHFPLLAPWIIFIFLYMLTSWILYRSSVRHITRRDRL